MIISSYNPKDKIKNRIFYLENRLAEIVKEAKFATEEKKKFLRVGYKLLLEEKRKLEKSVK
jgi:hypothetical protein